MSRQAYEFSQDECNLTIATPVPAHTSAKDVSIAIRADRLVVSVVGHARQPSVLDGVLFFDVDPDSLDWELTGSGDGRALVLTLEKAEPIDWDEGLFRRDTACEAPQPDLARDWRPTAPSSAQPPAAAPAPAAAAAPVPATEASSSPSVRARSRAATDYSRFDRLELSDDEDDPRRGQPLALAGDAERIWSELMSGEKKLLTRDGVVAAAAAPAGVADGREEIASYGQLD